MIETNIKDYDNWKNIKNKVAIAVCSGGMDSTSMGLALLDDDYEVIFCHGNLKQKSEEKEKRAIKNIVNHLRIDKGLPAYYFIVDIDWLGELGGSSLTSSSIPVSLGMDSILESSQIATNLENPGLWTPGRNIVLLSIGAALADRIGAKVVALGANQSELAYRDNTMDFLKSFELMSRFGTLVMPKFDAPLYDKDKAEILKWYVDEDFYDILQYTWSCDKGNTKPCGSCGCCNNRRLAFFILNNLFRYSEDNYGDNQEYVDNDYFMETFLPEAVRRFKTGLWYEPYIDELRKFI